MTEGVNASGRPEMAPQPAEGLAFDARGVLGPVNPDPWERLMMLAQPPKAATGLTKPVCATRCCAACAWRSRWIGPAMLLGPNAADQARP